MVYYWYNQGTKERSCVYYENIMGILQVYYWYITAIFYGYITDNMWLSYVYIIGKLLVFYGSTMSTGLYSSAYQPGLRHQTSLFSKLKDEFRYEVLVIIPLPTNKNINY